MNERQVIDGVRLPSQHALTDNELAWISFIRTISEDTDPPPTLRSVQLLRVMLGSPSA